MRLFASLDEEHADDINKTIKTIESFFAFAFIYVFFTFLNIISLNLYFDEVGLKSCLLDRKDVLRFFDCCFSWEYDVC